MREIVRKKNEMTWEEAQAAAIKEGGRLPKYEDAPDFGSCWVDERNVFVQKGVRHFADKGEKHTAFVIIDDCSSKGTKHDDGKLRWDLMPMDIWEHIVWLHNEFIEDYLTIYQKIKLAKEQDWCLLAAGLLMGMEDYDSILGVITEGAKKYGENNWQLVENAEQRYFAALMRHLDKEMEINADDFGLPHSAHAVVNCIFLQWFENKRRIR